MPILINLKIPNHLHIFHSCVDNVYGVVLKNRRTKFCYISDRGFYDGKINLENVADYVTTWYAPDDDLNAYLKDREYYPFKPDKKLNNIFQFIIDNYDN